MASETKHTSGPWGYDIEPYSTQMVRSEGGLIAQVIGDSAETEANGLLIAAAPDMLAALEEATDVLSSRYQNLTTGHWDDGELQLLAQQIAAAIAKATS